MSVDHARIRKVAEDARKYHDDDTVDYYSVAEMYLDAHPDTTDEDAAYGVAMSVAFR